jgi:hypothetical protein
MIPSLDVARVRRVAGGLRSAALLVSISVVAGGCFLPRPTQGPRATRPPPAQRSEQDVWRAKLAELVPVARDNPEMLWQTCERIIRSDTCSRSEPRETALCMGTLKKRYYEDTPVGRVALMEQMGCSLDRMRRAVNDQG